MTKKSFLIIAGLMLIIGGSITAVALVDPVDTPQKASENAQTASSSTSQSISVNSNSTSSQKSTITTSTGSYQDYDEQKVTDTKGTRVLFFYAPWCPQCRSIEKGINAESLPDGVAFFKVDYDSRQDLRKKYGVTLQTTFIVLDDRGTVAKKHVAYDEPTFDAVKKAIL